MANLLTTSDNNFTISWIRRSSRDGQRLHLTLSGKSGIVIGKAIMSADYIRDYIIINSMSEAKTVRIAKLCKELEDLLYDAPEEYDCTQEEADMYAEMSNLYQSMSRYIDIQKVEGAM
jgi:hypothetical protein